jgi:hypothetical protein
MAPNPLSAAWRQSVHDGARAEGDVSCSVGVVAGFAPGPSALEHPAQHASNNVQRRRKTR